MVHAKCDPKDKQLTFDVFELIPAFTNQIASHKFAYPVYLVGDAIATTHFFTGTGVNFGFQTAHILAQLLQKYGPRIPINEYKDLVYPEREKMWELLAAFYASRKKLRL